MKFEFKEHTDKGLVREVNEDNLGHSLNSKNGDVFVVCDGMGGHVGGQTASTIGVNALLSELTTKPHNNMHVAISQALTFANEQVLGHAEADPSLKGMGSTATVCLFKDDLLYVGHVGDSRAYIYSDKKLYRITRDDSYVQELVDKGVITEDEAEMHPNKNRILQALGSTSALTPRIPKKPFKLKTGDLLLLCSDGLTSMVVDELIEQLINPQDLGGTLQELHKIAMTNGGKDNITMTLVKITESPYLQNDFDHFTVKYNKKHTAASHKITGTPPPMDISVPAKKKLPMSYILGAAAVLLVIVAGYFYMKPLNDTETPKVVNTEPKKIENPKDTVPDETYTSIDANTNYNNNADTDGDGVKNEDDQCPNKSGPKKNKGCPIKNDPLEKWINDSIQARQSLQELYDRFGGDFKGRSDCSECDADSLKSCKDQMGLANQKWKYAVDALKKKRKPKKG
ncbi:MAG: Stp1/IreP family PP2C-type Ser/Thr phosphatase [Flavobacteriia bacterium]|nr:Stp1/IreP family PP2C-type Ser/Thr phosphatase [Flavobacteriia bacterium]